MSPYRVPPAPHSRGFTLIELLVVIFIISILIASVLTVVPKVKRAVYAAQTQAELSTLANAIQQYYSDFKSYPGPLPNSQLDWNEDAVSANLPSVYYNGNTQYQLGASNPYLSGSAYNPPTTGIYKNITGSQNLTLGLLGGLELTTVSGVNGLQVSGFVYNPADIFADGVNPSPKGPASLNFASPKRQNAYMTVKLGDLSTPNNTYNSGNGASFADEAQRAPADAMIPVFLDKYSSPLPILYYRTNVGATAIVGVRAMNTAGSGNIYVDDSSTQLTDPNNVTNPVTYEVPQYDLVQNALYVFSKIGTIASNSNSFHGLRGLGTSANLSDTIDVKNADGTYSPSNGGKNGIAYFKDPSLNSTYDPSVSPAISNVHLGVARQKDGFVLISAGPDRLYGTHDDLIFPGPLQP